MTQKEFEERTELKLTADNYTEVETCYMNTDLDKDAFCKLWMKNPAALKLSLIHISEPTRPY